jgi:hypothetical protein
MVQDSLQAGHVICDRISCSPFDSSKKYHLGFMHWIVLILGPLCPTEYILGQLQPETVGHIYWAGTDTK